MGMGLGLGRWCVAGGTSEDATDAAAAAAAAQTAAPLEVSVAASFFCFFFWSRAFSLSSHLQDA